MRGLGGFLLLFVPTGLTAQAANPDLAGIYDGGQRELAAFLELRPDGRFQYALTTGALDQQAQGNWMAEGNCAILESDPFTRPEFHIVRNEPTSDADLILELNVAGGGEPAYFDYVLHFADGTASEGQLSRQPRELDFSEGPLPIAVSIELDIFDLESEAVELPESGGRSLTFLFQPNDLGTVEFSHSRACVADGILTLPVGPGTLTMRKVEANE